jgi:uncharacterized DUF497 family protein
MKFEWDDSKDKINIKKHKISFAEAKEIFKNPIVTWTDDRHYYGEVRKISIGRLSEKVVLTVVYTERNDKRRLISARKAKSNERKLYYAYLKKKT